ncbi:acyl-ACP--UDP-N- acetylglucosamine O-acyltransferase [Geodermatophilus sp. DF01-2]|uniref:acyl-ACP--UDP-N- acetylglucosamine O-acyltransferase n=1 Tax=Geodermatophilus sp. DF01-2 TaxID=2559610 RepID=UPI0010732D73|nr:acyl-ACP--UDP-N- acetylglucosamine O-acyltransferase [Geodermatophilus sp. DF01_2]TFV64164.1 acyl-ACP--UDP-N- acetylglucosamine O-acyltransferase [Geodermatophilus sp. DF01_2]
MPNRIHHTAVVGPEVELGTGNVVGPYAVLVGPCRIGDDNWIGPHVVLGSPPEIRGHDHGAAWDGELVGCGVEVGSRTTLREYTTVHSGSASTTRIGSDCFVMNKVYVGHDGNVGDGVTMASTVTLGGHVTVGDRANLGLGATVHQRRVIGPGVMLGMGSVVTRDIPPYAKAFGNPARLQGVNSVGMSRQGMDDADIGRLAELYGSGADIATDWPASPPLEPALEWWRRHASAS